MWLICFVLSVTTLLSGAAVAFVKGTLQRRNKSGIDYSKFFMAGVLLSAFFLFFPIYSDIFGDRYSVVITVLASIHNVIRLFVVDADFSFITTNFQEAEPWLRTGYVILFAVLYIIAPILTFNLVLSFFKNISAYEKYLLRYNSEVYVFSELNDKSLALAQSIDKRKGKKILVFTNVNHSKSEDDSLIKAVKAIGAVCFSQDITTVNFRLHSKHKKISFFTISGSGTDNTSDGLALIEKYRDRENTELYVFSTQVASEMLFAKVDRGYIKLRRVNEVRSLIYRNLYDDGSKIFDNSVEKDGSKLISAVILGMGQIGTEMTKALAWFGQMDGYKLIINSFDKDKSAADKFVRQCTELMDDKHNGNFTDDGESQYKIDIHGGYEADSQTFAEKIKEIGMVTYVLVSLGNDEENISTAVDLRTLFERMGIKPMIQAVVFDSSKRKALESTTNYANQPYGIDFIGDFRTLYSDEVILTSDLEEKALARHLKWGKEEEFWAYEYNYRSSVASAIHYEMKLGCGIPGAELPPDKREEADKIALRKLEHRRWNAYVRSEGYCVAPKRNQLAKVHHNLVTFDDLDEATQKKDDD